MGTKVPGCEMRKFLTANTLENESSRVGSWANSLQGTYVPGSKSSKERIGQVLLELAPGNELARELIGSVPLQTIGCSLVNLKVTRPMPTYTQITIKAPLNKLQDACCQQVFHSMTDKNRYRTVCQQLVQQGGAIGINYALAHQQHTVRTGHTPSENGKTGVTVLTVDQLL